MHPTTRDELDGGAPIAESVLSEEDVAEHLMARMEDMDSESQEFLNAFRQLRDDVLEHADHEEREEFPRLRASLSEDRLHSMADGFEKVKSRAPTHPHPNTLRLPRSVPPWGRSREPSTVLAMR